ncbi:TetR/AcrR family transcriptional regulator [Massilia glaciei]|uniref:TetR/AcrR family transcriptional regulator n=1 Tax=Massilia glaciei TaxID=1524097 RepID=A0A2U2HNU7_9BURK|nr:TetR/AcrR family transcriptional regulator [Massilia glaciei]PWF49173.1 TetR/AcrR family transcriptional regulator [Massilia glaciei]
MKTTDARTRLVGAMVDALQRRGLHGSGLTELLAAAGAPKGVMYHHFPGGKTELAVTAIGATVARLCHSLDQALDAAPGDAKDPGAALMAWVGGAQQKLDASNYERGCPLATIALETTAADTAIRAALADGFATLRARIAAALVRAGYAEAGARAMAALLVAAYEGGLLQARVAGNPEPMSLVRDALLCVLNSGALKGATK